MAPDETTRAFIDMYARTEPTCSRTARYGRRSRLRERLAHEPHALVVTLLPGRELVGAFLRYAERFKPRPTHSTMSFRPGSQASGLKVAHRYALPNGRRYALLEAAR